ncbi:MAG: hypothetical protein FWD64_04400 [Acidobacteriaceae bacterium]|nr:hypothetical protein [Acidobacteriaceae bacterium]
MKMKNTCWLVLLLITLAVAGKGTSLHSQVLTTSISSNLNFTLKSGTLSPGGTLQINILCTPGVQTCPASVSVYADFPAFCGLSAVGGSGASVPASLVEARVNRGEMIPFNSPVPPAYNGCGAMLYNNVTLRPAGQTSLPVSMFIDLRNSSVPASVMFQGTLRITIDTL